MPKGGEKERRTGEPVTPPEMLIPPLHPQQPLDSVQANLLLAVGELQGRVAQLEDQLRRITDRLEKFSEKLYLALGIGAAVGFLIKYIVDTIKR